MHLGGPDTITAYALEDNELWLRHFVGLLSQSALTVYIIIMSWKGNWLSYLTILMLIIGIIKYGERTWSLYWGSIKHLRDSFLRSIDTSRKSEQWQKLLQRSFLKSIYIFVNLFVDLVLSPWDMPQDRSLYAGSQEEGSEWSNPFILVHYELKLMYDVFYTKAFANYGIVGLMSRLITLFTTVVVLVLYAILTEKKEHQVVDHIITCFLLVGALIAEIYAFILLVISRRTRLYFITKGLPDSAFSCLQDWIDQKFGKGEVRISLGQSNFFNLICYTNLKSKGNFFTMNKLEELPSDSHCLISVDLQIMIHRRLCDKSNEGLQSNRAGAAGYRRLLLRKNKRIFSSELEFHRTIITWHIATQLLYEFKIGIHSDCDSTRKNCKEMSDYMFYLLVKQRHMLPVGAGLITLRDTIIEVEDNQSFKKLSFSKGFRLNDTAFNRNVLLRHFRKLMDIGELKNPTARDDEVSKIQSTSVLSHALAIARELKNEYYRGRRQTWEFIEELWVEILSYASAQCRVDMHAQQLRRGPEFLSHLWLLQAHLGLLDQFQMTPHQTTDAAREPNSPFDAAAREPNSPFDAATREPNSSFDSRGASNI